MQRGRVFVASALRSAGVKWWERLACASEQRRAKGFMAYETVQSTAPSKTSDDGADPLTAVIVHGLLGSGRNWRSITRSLITEAASTSGRPWRADLVDQRCHGASTLLPCFHPPHTIDASAADLAAHVHHELHGRVTAIAGHSLGGKVVLSYLRKAAAGEENFTLPKQVWVLDANIGRPRVQDEPCARSDVERVIGQIADIPTPIPSRDWLYAHLKERGFTTGLQQWLGTNLVPLTNGKGFRWAFDITGAAAMFLSYQRSDFWDLVSSPPPGVQLHIVRAVESDRWGKDELKRLDEAVSLAKQGHDEGRAGQLNVHVLQNAGHWLHVDNPRGLHELMLPCFQNP